MPKNISVIWTGNGTFSDAGNTFLLESGVPSDIPEKSYKELIKDGHYPELKLASEVDINDTETAVETSVPSDSQEPE